MWSEPRPANPPRRGWRDWALVGVIVALAIVEGLVLADLPWRWLSLTVVIGLAITLLWRRTHPLLMVLIAFVVSGLVSWLFPGAPEMHVTVFLLILPYALFRWGSGREAIIGFAVMLADIVVSVAVQQLGLGEAIGGLAVLLAAAMLGVAIRYRHRARAREMEKVRLLERERLARDLHDTVAHRFSAIAIRAQAGLATAATSPDAPVEALHIIENEASQALSEMRAIVRVLRDDEPAERTPTPGISDLPGLAGQLVSVSLSGALDDVAPAVGTAIYRLAQESVTNARRHARHATRIEVSLHGDDREVRLLVRDNGESAHTQTAGFGLVGMRERALLLGGTFSAGPEQGGGWAVTAVLPRSGTPS